MATSTPSQNGVRTETDMDTVQRSDLFLNVVAYLSTYYSLILVTVGTVCNCLSFLVLSRRSYRDTAMSVFLRCLAVSDTMALLSGLLRFFILSTFHVPDPRFYIIGCHIHFWVSQTSLYSSSWTLVVVTLERTISIAVPHKVRLICTSNTARIFGPSVFVTWGLALTCQFAIFGHLQVQDPLTNTTFVRHCTVVYNQEISALVYWTLDGVNFAFLPALILIIANVIIVQQVIRSRTRVKKTYGNRTTKSRLQMSNETTSKTFPQNPGTKTRKENKEMSLTVTVVTINISYIICTFPICSFQQGQHHQSAAGLGMYGEAITRVLLLLAYTNNGLNFFLYCLTGTRFRNELKLLLKGLFDK